MGTMREVSKLEFTNPSNSDSIKLGALQRIADATEMMAKNHVRLVADRDMYEKMYRQQVATTERLSRQVSALRGVITRLKKAATQQANTEQSE